MHGLANLGRFYEEGVGILADTKNAIAQYELAAQLGSSWAKNQLGCLLIKSDKPEEKEKAIYWFRDATENDNYPRSMLNLAWAYYDGIVLEKNIEEAYRLIYEAAVRGEIEAQFNLGVMLLNGEGVEINKEKGVYWIEKARDQGFLPAYKLINGLSGSC